MTKENKNIFITTPIFYPNSSPHLGHLHTCFLGDFLTRTFKLFNYNVYFSTGTDEHGQKIDNTAKKQNITPKELVDQTSLKFKELMKHFDIQYDRFIRTTDPDHEKNVLLVWNKLIKNKYLYRGIYKGLYSEKDECFYSDNETIVNEKNIRTAISSGNEVVEIEEECWFFALSKFKEKLLNFYDENFITIPKNLKNELISYISNLKDLCVSRKINWGIKIPRSNETIYVWIDALFNYISSIGNIETFDKNLWNNTIHLMAKDIVIFHGVYWPALLMAVDINPSIKLLVHGWWLVDNSKMSKSIGNIIDPFKFSISPDYLRYFCLRSDLIGHDGQIHLGQIETLINNELIDKFLNLIFRFFSLIKTKIGFNKTINLQVNMDKINLLKKDLKKSLVTFSPKQYIATIIQYASECNQYIEKYQLWKKMTQEHLDYLLPIVCNLIKYSGGIQTSWEVNSYFEYKEDNNTAIFILKDLKTLFNKINKDHII